MKSLSDTFLGSSALLSTINPKLFELPPVRQSHDSGRTRRGYPRRSPASRERRRAKRSRLQAAVNKLTNHERNRWARAGYPTDGKRADALLAPGFARLAS